MGTFWQGLRYGTRLLIKRPGFTAIAVVTLALGIGGATAIFSVVDGVLLRPLPYPKANRIVRVYEVTHRNNRARLSDPDFLDLRRQISGLSGLAEFNSDREPVVGGSEPTLATVASVSQDFFRVMGVRPFLGHEFSVNQLYVGGTPVVLVSYGFWQRYLGGAPNFSSHHLKVSGHLVTIIGVMPAGFNYPGNTEMWFPRELFPMSSYRTGLNWLGIGRLREGVTLAEAQAQATAVAQRLRQEYGDSTYMVGVKLVPLRDQIVGNARPALLILLGAVGLLLLVACANVANLLLAQAAGRQRELAVRVALGATHRHLTSQFVAESLLLSVAGSLLGLPVAVWGVEALLALEPGKLPRARDVGVHPAVLGFAAGVAIVIAVALGLVTALRSASGDVQESLKGGERTQTGGTSSHRLRLMLMGGQVAVTLVLLVGAVLLARSLFDLLTIHPGFESQHVLAMNLLDVWPETPAEKLHLVNVLDTITGRLRAVPGVDAVGVVSALPLTGLSRSGGYLVVDSTEKFSSMKELAKTYLSLAHDPARTGHAVYLVASAGYFHAMGIPLLRGRLFRHGDGPEAPSVAVVSQSFAENQWPSENPLGKMIEFGNMDGDLQPFRIVGVVGDVRNRSLGSPAVPTFYSYYRQRPANDFSVVMRTSRSTADLVPIARQMERAVEPGLPVSFQTMDQIVSASTAGRRFNLVLLGTFALTALVLSLMGVYGVGSYLVSQRTKEIGIRLALGAQTGDVVRMIAGQGLRVILVGAAVGLAGALALTRVLESLLYGVKATDPPTYIGVALLVVATGYLACYLPARHAARVNPIDALREQ